MTTDGVLIDLALKAAFISTFKYQIYRIIWRNYD